MANRRVVDDASDILVGESHARSTSRQIRSLLSAAELCSDGVIYKRGDCFSSLDELIDDTRGVGSGRGVVAAESNTRTGAGCPTESVGGAADVTGSVGGGEGSGSSSVFVGSDGGDGGCSGIPVMTIGEPTADFSAAVPVADPAS